MNEIEVKVLNINKAEVLAKLEKLNAINVKKEFQANYMFDFPDKKFSNKQGYVRIRSAFDFNQKKEKITLTSKELISKDKFKISKEYEFKAYEFENAKLFLESLGLEFYRLDEKYRESYELEEGLVEIDTWAGVPTYFEVEAETEDKVKSILEKLGYTLEQSTSMTLKEIMLHYGIEDVNRMFSEEEKKKFFNE